MPFGLGIWEILILAGILVLLFGARARPAMARRLGAGVREMKDAVSEMDPRSVFDAKDEPEKPKPKAVPALEAARSQASPAAVAEVVPESRTGRRRYRGDRRPSSRLMDVVAYATLEPFTTKDGSTIREFIHSPAQSLAEATLEPGQSTMRHYHALSEEIYLLTRGGGTMELDGDVREVGEGDAILIPPGAGMSRGPAVRACGFSAAAFPRTATTTRISRRGEA